MSRPKGIFIAIEGIDAAGKRTQTSILRAWFGSKGMTTHTISFPAYDTTIGKEIRNFLDGSVDYPQQVRAMLYAANRWEKRAEIEAMLAKTDATIVDRYSGSNLAYGVSNGLDLEWLLHLEEGLPEPDLVLLLDASPTKLVPRRGDRKDSYERNISLQEKARDAYVKLAKRFGWSVVDANGGIEETSRALISTVSESLKAKLQTKR
ncbi:MAG TPA: dTMP kinase [Nitrososphaerales archaeon]|nr:dTMP kinase [Nitrososphaerales archaeon]